jgi:hypothetical protein
MSEKKISLQIPEAYLGKLVDFETGKESVQTSAEGGKSYVL